MPTLVNVFVYMISFLVKTVTWSIMLYIFDFDDTDNDRLMQGAYLFLLDYGAAYAIKVSIFMFIFEMMQVRVLMVSQSHE